MNMITINRAVLSLLVVGLLFSDPAVRAEITATELQADNILSVMTRACDWQLANLPAEALITGKLRPIKNTDWIRAAFFTGVMATYESTGEEKYLDAAKRWARENEWKPGVRPRHADDHCVGQTYAEIYFAEGDVDVLGPVRATFDALIADPKPGREDWSWCDSLFMAPPVLARLSAATGDAKYIDFMNRMWWDTTDHLYDTEEHLYYRDKRYMEQEDGTWLRRSPNDKKIFWSRGNGWVMGGTARVLQYMPRDYPDRPKYISLFKEMAAKIASVQGEDGLWRSSLLDAPAYPAKETSGSGFFCYALAWGINEGILDRDKYLPVVHKAWIGLVDAVDERGKLGWVQLVGRDPKLVTREDTMEYGTGAFLLAGSEILKLTLPTLTVSNTLQAARQDETISIVWSRLDLPSHWAGRIVMRETETGSAHIAQAIDIDADGTPEELIFQSTFAPGQIKSFALQVVPDAANRAPSRVHAKFVPTRYDDFAWENDRIAFRMYGPALQHTDTNEKLISSGIDVWGKSVSKLVLEDWYQPGNNYHKDKGEGLDFYKVGPSRGCGGLAVWEGGAMHLSENYTEWKIVANGPIRTIFELSFAPWDVNGKKISEIKRITLDAGANMNRFDSFFTTDGKSEPLTYAIGLHIAKVDDREVAPGKGQIVVWEPAGENGNLGLAIVADPADVVEITEAEGHNLLIAKTAADGHATFYAGAGWDKSADFSSSEDWSEYVAGFARRISSPLVVSTRDK